MQLPPPEQGPAMAVDGRDRPDGQAELDPAHGGPLPQATLIELIGRVLNDVSDLADRQIDLAKQEIGEARDDAFGAVKRAAIGAGIAVAALILLVIWAWSAFIWFFNWLGSLVQVSVPPGSQVIGLVAGALIGVAAGVWIGITFWHGWWRITLAAIVGILLGALIGGYAGLGWLLGALVPGLLGVAAYRFIFRGINEAMAIWPPLPRTRDTLKEDLEWVRRLRTRNAR
jgi:hypothetical protein